MSRTTGQGPCLRARHIYSISPTFSTRLASTRDPIGLDQELFCDSELVCAEFLITDLACVTCLGYGMRCKYLNVSALTLDLDHYQNYEDVNRIRLSILELILIIVVFV